MEAWYGHPARSHQITPSCARREMGGAILSRSNAINTITSGGSMHAYLLFPNHHVFDCY